MENSDNFQEFIIIDDLSAYGIDEEEARLNGKMSMKRLKRLLNATECDWGSEDTLKVNDCLKWMFTGVDFTCNVFHSLNFVDREAMMKALIELFEGKLRKYAIAADEARKIVSNKAIKQ